MGAAGTPNLPLQGPSVFGNTYNQYKETDGGLWVPFVDFSFPNGTWTVARDQAGLLHIAKTAGAATTNPMLNLGALLMNKIGADPIAAGSPNLASIVGAGHDIRGVQVTAFDLIYTIGTANLTSITPLFWRSLFRDNQALPTPANPAGTLNPTTLPVTQRANAYVSHCAVGTPYIIGNNAADTLDILEFAIVDPGTSVFNLYGLYLYFNYNIL